MVIKSLKLSHFNKFEELSIEFSESFTLLVGENGSGKTTILDALMIAASRWSLVSSVTNKAADDYKPTDANNRLVGELVGDRIQFRQSGEARVDFHIHVGDRVIRAETATPYTPHPQDHLNLAIKKFYESSERVEPPVLALFSAHRGVTLGARSPDTKPSRWDVYRNTRIDGLNRSFYSEWFKNEAIAFANEAGSWRPGYLAVKNAVVSSIVGAEDLFYHGDLRELVVSFDGVAQPLSNLSAGQRMMIGMVIDIAIRAVTLNAHLLEDGPDNLLENCPGLVLIDELDVHLHPGWQRSVASDLQKTFPAMQFVATSHSPQIIGEVPRENIRILRQDGTVETPSVSQGADSNWILDHIMTGSSSRSDESRRLIEAAEAALDNDEIDAAERALDEFEEYMGGVDGKVVGLRSRLDSLKLLLD